MKQHLKNLLRQGDTRPVIDALLAATQDQPRLHEEVIMQAAHFEAYERDLRIGTISVEEGRRERAKIHQALLYIIGQLAEEAVATIPKPSSTATEPAIDTPPAGKWWRWVVGIGLLIAIPAGIAEVSGYSLRDWFGGDAVDSFSLTVFVHGEDGKDDRILRNQGKVVLDIGTARQEATINEKGEATFKELPTGYLGETALLSIDHPQPYFPKERDKEYLLERGKPIYLEVALQGLNKIKGRVLDFYTEEPLDSVRVSVQNSATFSDVYGWFELEIPPDRQDKFVRVTFFKQGYGLETLDSIAPHTQQEIGISLIKQRQ